MGLLRAIAITAGAGGAVVSAPIVLGAVGFTTAGIAAGSYAASRMSAAADGGGAAAGSLVAVFQSGAQLLHLTARSATAAVGSVGGAVGFLATLI